MGRAKQPASDVSYKRANTDWLAKCRFGIGIHWTAQTVPRSSSPKPFQKAVGDFDLDGSKWWRSNMPGQTAYFSRRPMPGKCRQPCIPYSTEFCRAGPANVT